MLQNIHGQQIDRVPRQDDFAAYCRQLDEERLEAVRAGLDRIIDEMSPDYDTGLRHFSSSWLGSSLTPWPTPIAHLNDVAREMLGEGATEEEIVDQAGLIFGLFVWECVMQRDELWTVYDPNLSDRDPNREITGKRYFEAG